MSMMKIFLTAFPLQSGRGRVIGSRPGGDVLGSALAADGVALCSHLSSSVDFAKHDMGLTSDWKHEHYQKHAPDGYELEWVDDPATHDGWQAALTLNRALELSGSPVQEDAVSDQTTRSQ